MGIFSKERTKDPIEHVLDGAVRIHGLGYLGLTITALSIITFLSIIGISVYAGQFFLNSISEIIPWIIVLVIFVGATGIFLVVLERIISLRMAETKMKMIVSITEKMTDGVISKKIVYE